MRIAKLVVAALVPAGVACVAFLNADAIAALVSATVDARALLPASGATMSNASVVRQAKSADAILDRNPFDHATGPLRGSGASTEDALASGGSSATCEGVRALVLVAADDPAVAFAALDVGGQRVLRRRGGEVMGMRLAHVGRERVWFERGDGSTCHARLFGPPPQPVLGVTAKPELSASPAGMSAFEADVASKIVKTGTNEYAIDRATVDRIIDAQAELMKARILPAKEGDRVVGVRIFGVKQGSVLATLGIENGDLLETINGFEVSSPEKMLEAYARLRAGADKLTVHLTRAGRPVNLDYSVR